jgi:hypothetical protein
LTFERHLALAKATWQSKALSVRPTPNALPGRFDRNRFALLIRGKHFAREKNRPPSRSATRNSSQLSINQRHVHHHKFTTPHTREAAPSNGAQRPQTMRRQRAALWVRALRFGVKDLVDFDDLLHPPTPHADKR